MASCTLGVISDTHIPLELAEMPEALLHELKGVDVIVHAGDFVDHSVLGTLESLGPPVFGVLGNLDGTDLRRALPPKRVESFNGARVGIIHGWGPPTRLPLRVRRRFTDVDLVIHGHSHIPGSSEIEGVRIVNPGSVCHNRDGTRSYALIHLDGGITVEMRDIKEP